MTPVEKVRLPLFPLPVVLFPGASMPLHIFEPRYRRMVARCLEHDGRFGLLYHDADTLGPFLIEEGRVGCVAHIRDFQPLPDGRSLVVVEGEGRFAIDDGIESTEPFYEALVLPYEDREEPAAGLESQRRRTLALFHAVLRTLADEGVVPPEIPAEGDVSFPLVRTLQVHAPWQQAFLELRSELHRLERLDAVFQAALDA